jgi:hypothetical protein
MFGVGDDINEFSRKRERKDVSIVSVFSSKARVDDCIRVLKKLNGRS